MRLFALLLLTFGLVLLIIDLGSHKPKKILCSGKPCNVILIVVDTLGAKHLGIYGYERDTSPFIDSFFSKNSLVFKNAISNATWTNPSFASFLTSRYASEIPVRSWWDQIPPNKPNFVQILRESGINVGLIAGNPQFRKKPPADQSVFQEKEITISRQGPLFLSASEWLINQKSKNSPFFLMIHNWTVHSPYNPPAKYRTLFTEVASGYIFSEAEILNEKRSLEKALAEGKTIKKDFDRFRLPYDQTVRYLDDELKDFFGAIPKEILDTSTVVLTADHGEAFGEHNYIMHNIKPYQEVIHVPLLIRTPDQANKTIDINVSLLDLAPTILNIYGLVPPKEFKGASLWQLITDEKSQERIVKSEFFRLKYSDPNQISLEEPTTAEMIETYVNAGTLGNWKVINVKTKPELYNLKNDPNEKNNLIEKLSDIETEDKKYIELLFRELGVSIN